MRFSFPRPAPGPWPLLLALPALACAAILPDTIGPWQRTATSPPALADQAVWQEYGLKAAETDTYANGSQHFTVTAWQLQDPTSAMAAFQWQRPADSKPSKAAPLAAETPDSLMVAEGNYVLYFTGHKVTTPELAAAGGSLKNVDETALPVLPSYLPDDHLVANSERYITGPASLQKFEPSIPPSVAAFHLGAEAQIGVFHNPNGDATLAIFNYPTPQIAMQRVIEFSKLPNSVVKRSGPLVAVVLGSPDPDFSERLLGKIRYQAQVVQDEYTPVSYWRGWRGLILGSFVFIGLLLAFAATSGLALGGFRVLWRRTHKGQEPETMITLHLEER